MSKLPPIKHGIGKNAIICNSGVTADAENTTVFGKLTEAKAENAISIGYNNKATGKNSLSSGNTTEASGNESATMGVGTIANHRGQYAFGAYNIVDTNTNPASQRGKYIELIGNGNAGARSNARTLD